MSLNNIELYSICMGYDLPLQGIYMKDELVKIKNIENGLFIINMDSSTDSRGGTHWICCYFTDKSAFYFDSFGCVCPTEIDIFIKRRFKKYYWNGWICQDMSSDLCGFFCVGLGIHIKHHFTKDLITTCNDYVNYFQDDTKKNDATLRKYFSMYKPINKIVMKKLLNK